MSSPVRARAAGGLAGAAVLIAGLTVLARAVGFGRWLVFSGTVGSGCVGTAYSTANQLPNVLFEVLAGGALAGAVVPLLAGPLAAGRREEADRIASALLTWTVTALVPATVVLALLAGPLTSALLVHSGGCPGEGALAARMLLVFAPQLLLYGVGIVMTGILQAHHRFAGPALAPLLSSLVVIAAYALYGVQAAGHQREPGWVPSLPTQLVLSVGTTLGVLALSLPLLLPLHRAGTRLRMTWSFPAGVARRAAGLAAAGITALLAQQAAVLAAFALANGVGGPGAVNVYQYVQAVYVLPYAVLAVPLATAAFPRMSAQAAEATGERYASTVARTTRLVLLVSAAGAAVLVAAAPAVQAVFGRLDAAKAGPLSAMAITLTAFAPGLLGFGLVAHAGRALYAAGRGRAAAGATAAGWLVVVAGSVLGVLALAQGTSAPDSARATVLGLGLGNTAGMTVAGVLLVVALRRAAGATAVVGVLRTAVVGVLGGVVGAVLGRLVADLVLGAGPGVSPGLVRAVAAGVVGSVSAAAVVTGVLAVTDRSDLRALLRRLPARAPRPTEVGR